RPAVRYRYAATLGERSRPGAGQNPPPGAILHYNLKARPKGDITLEVLDAKGGVVQTLTSKKPPEEQLDVGEYSGRKYRPLVLPAEPGLHRVVWDLRYRGAETIRGAKLDSGQPQQGPLVNPGTYKLRLTVEGKPHETELEVKLSPREDPGVKGA